MRKYSKHVISTTGIARYGTANDNMTDAEGTDWWDETVKKVATMQSYNLSFQGGSDKIVYSGSVGYFRQNHTTIMVTGINDSSFQY